MISLSENKLNSGTNYRLWFSSLCLSSRQKNDVAILGLSVQVYLARDLSPRNM